MTHRLFKPVKVHIFTLVWFLYRRHNRGYGVVKNRMGNPVVGAVVRLINLHIPQLKYPPVQTKVGGRI